MTNQPWKNPSLIVSFGHTFEGIAFMLRTQRNARIHAACTLAVLLAGSAFGVTAADWRWLIVAIGLVWVSEGINTAFEHLCDVVSPEFNVSVKHAKDVAAGAVTIAAFCAALIGLMVFWPYLATHVWRVAARLAICHG